MKSLQLTIAVLLLSCAVQATPLPITGPSGLCVGVPGTMADATPGGTWSVSSTAIATIGASTGIVTGVISGVVTVTYTAGGSYVTTPLTINAIPTPISGPTTLCAGDTVVLWDGTSGGAWTSSNPAVGYMGMPGLIGLTAGVTTVTYALGSGCAATIVITVDPVPPPITGTDSVCTGGTTALSDAAVGGAWSSSVLTDGTIDPLTGVFTGIGTGTTLVHYTVPGGCSAVLPVSVLPSPALSSTLTPPAICDSTVFSYMPTSTTPGATFTWYRSAVTGISNPASSGAGNPNELLYGSMSAPVTVPYTYVVAAGGCTTTQTVTVTVNPITTPSVTVTASPGTTVCAGTTVTFNATPVGGGASPTYTWYKNGTATGTTSTYSYIPVSGDVLFVVMTSSAPCVTYVSAVSPSITMTVDVPTVTATASAPACGGGVTLGAGGAATYSWAPSGGLSCLSCISPTATPASTTIYTVTGTDALGCSGTATVSVDGNSISGHITYTGSPSDVFTVWLIQFNPSDSSIHALDSTSSCMDAGIPYYEFIDPIAGNYMVKAKLNSAVPGASGYIPTYSSSTPNWYAAAGVAHTSTADIMDITMVYGTVPAGPGFVSGYVVSGAGKGAAGDVPEAGMLIYLEDAAGHVITYTYTDAAGAYSFSSLANGNYIIYPETYKYYTTPFALTINAPGDTVTGINFKKHTTYGTITPNMTVCCTSPYQNEGIYPNPTSGALNIVWGSHGAGVVEIEITDMVGRVCYKSALPLTATQNKSVLDLSSLKEGMYFLTLNSRDISYAGKLMIVK